MLPHHNTLQQNHNELLLKLHTIKKGNEHHTEIASKKCFQYWEQPLTDFCHDFCIPALSISDIVCLPRSQKLNQCLIQIRAPSPLIYKGNLTDNWNVRRINVLFSQEIRN